MSELISGTGTVMCPARDGAVSPGDSGSARDRDRRRVALGELAVPVRIVGIRRRQALAASSSRTCSARQRTSRPRRDFRAAAASSRAPISTVETVGRCSSQFSAICGIALAGFRRRLRPARRRRDTGARRPPAARSCAVSCSRLVCGQRLAAADLAGEAAPAERAPHDRADALVERRAASAPIRSRGRSASSRPGGRRSARSRSGRRPPATSSAASRRSWSADVAHLAGAHQIVERRHHAFDRRHARRS